MKRLLVLFLMFVFLTAVSICSANTPRQFDGMKAQVESAASVQDGGDKKLYDKAYGLYENKKYFDAHELFVQSQYGDWERMAQKCVRRWPKNGETWRDNTQWLQDTRLTFKVEQPEDTAIYIRIYKDKQPLSYVFIGGTDEISLMVPGNGNYSIMDGVGKEWFGTEDTFGTNGAYEHMTFGKNENETIYLEARYSYLVTINVEDVIGEDIGTEDAEWTDFRK